MNDKHDLGHGGAAPSLEQLLTTYLMGEADAATAARVEAALAEDDVLRAKRDAMVEVLDLLKASPTAAPATLAPERRDALRAEAAAMAGGSAVAGGRSPWWQSPSLRAAAAVVLFGGLVALWQPWSGSGVESMPGTQAQAPEDFDPEMASASALAGKTPARKDGPVAREFAGLAELGYADGGDALRESAPAEEAEVVLDEMLLDSLGSLGYMGGGGGGATGGGGAGVFGNPNQIRVDAVEDPAVVGGIYALTPTGKPDATLGLELADRWSADAPAAEPLLVPSAPATPGSPTTPAPEASVQLAYEREVARVQQPARKRAEDTRGRFKDDFDLEVLGEDDGLAQLGYCVVDGYGRAYYGEDVIGHLRPTPQEKPRDMFFRYYGDNAAVLTATEPLSTFAADVDSASYALSRAYLVDGNLPPKAAVRSEEFINYFDYALPAPAEEDFSVLIECAPSAFSQEPRQLLSVGVKAREVAEEARPAMNLVFVIDKSGSMEGERMQLVKDALELVIDQLREDDTLGLVTFDSRGSVLQEPIPVRERWKLRRAVRNLSTGGSTNAGEGIALGYQMIEQVFDPARINRVVLASDGVANTGETDQVRILEQVQAKAEAEVDLTTLGVGMGNHNDVFLEQLADRGDGSCHYLDDFAEAKRVLVDDFLGTMVVVGRELKIQVEFDPSTVQRWRQIGYENRSLTAAQFRDDTVDAGEVGAGQDVMALYELDLAPEADPEATLATVRLRWIPDGAAAAVERSHELTVGEATSRWGLASKRLRLAGVSAQLAETMRRSWHARGDDVELLEGEAERLAGEWKDSPEVAELRDMIRRSQALLRVEHPQDEIAVLLEEVRRMHLRLAEIEQLQEGREGQEELIGELRRQNEALEARLQELLQGR